MRRIRDKILVVLVAIVLLMLVPTIHAVLALRQVNHLTADLRASLDLGIDARQEQLRECNTLYALHEATGDPDYARVADACAAEVRREAEALASLIDPRHQQEANRLRAAAECYAPRAGAPRGQNGEPVALPRDVCSVRIADALDAIQAEEIRRRARLTAGVESATRRALQFVLFSVAFTLLAAVAITSLLARSLVAPLKRILRGTRQVARGRFNQEVPVTTRDEIGELTSAFNSMARELDSLNKMKAEFLSVASHELKSPITSLRGYLEVLREEHDSLPAPELRRLLDRCEEETGLLLRYMNQFLDMNRIESGQFRFEPRDLPLEPFFEAEVEGFSYQARGRGIELRAEVAEGVPEEIRADADLLGQVIRNLLENALRYTPAGGTVVARIAPETEGTVVLEVCDTGPGLDPAEIDRVFEKYYRGTASDRARGSGLGLPISRAIVEAHGGRIWAEAGDGGGARFVCRLPTGSSQPRGALPGGSEVRKVAMQLLLATVFLLGGAAGCRAVGGRPAAPPSPDPPRPAPADPSPEQLLEEAESALRDGDPRSAAFLLEETLASEDLEAEHRRDLLMRMAMLHADPGSELYDAGRVRALLDRVLERHPGTPEARQAAVVRSLLEALQAQAARRLEAESRIEGLSTRMRKAESALGTCQSEIERIKQIILEREQPPPR